MHRRHHVSHTMQAILESEPFGISIKDITDAKKLGEDFAKELGETDQRSAQILDSAVVKVTHVFYCF